MTQISDISPQQDVSLLLNRLKSIVSFVMYAASADTLNEVLERIANISRELVGARYAALGIPNERETMEYFVVSGMTAEAVEMIPHPPLGRGLLGAIMLERVPIRLEHLSKDPRSSGFPENHPPMDRFLGVPIRVGDQLFGMLYLTDPLNGEPFTESDQWLIESMAGYAALAIAGAQLRDQRQRLTLLEERERIGMELHDGVIQSLYAIGMQVELARTDPDYNPDALKPVTQSLNDVIEDIRSYILDLRHRARRSETLRGCLQEMVMRLHIPSTLQIEIDAPDDTATPLSPEVFEALCQMANEALSNVIRHAGATQVLIRADADTVGFRMVITDNGRGFDPQSLAARNGHADSGSGLGLENMQRRAQLHGGSVTILSSPGAGTQVTILIPIYARTNMR